MPITPNLELENTGPFWKAAAENRLEIPYCERCDKLIWYPRKRCLQCDDKPVWTSVSGRGTITAFTVVRRPLLPDYGTWTPYVPALIAIEEDPSVRIVSQIVDSEPEEIFCDMSVEVVFRELKIPNQDSYMAPLFQLKYY